MTRNLLLLAIAILVAGGCYRQRTTQSVIEVHGLTATVTVSARHHRELPQASAGFQATADAILPLFDTTQPQSEIARINRIGSTGRIPLSRHMFRVLDLGRQYSVLTAYAYDYTAPPLAGLWREGPPDPLTLQNTLDRTGMRYVETTETGGLSLTSDGVQLDPRSLALAYCLDLGIVDLRRKLTGPYSIAFAGMIRREGIFADDEIPALTIQLDQRRLGIVRLDATAAAVTRTLDADRTAPSAPGAPRLIDPRSGYPASGARLAVVAGPLAMKAHALAEALLVVGPDRAPRLLDQFTGYEVMLVSARDPAVCWMTPGFPSSFRPASAFNLPVQFFSSDQRAD